MDFNYTTIKGDYLLLWQKFKIAFIETVLQTNFEGSWKSRGGRTDLYFKSVLPQVAKLMNLEFGEEMKFRVDGTFYTRSSQGNIRVPIVLIESENDAKTSDDEVYKLCLLNAPLKVLMICNDWDDQTKIELSEGYWEYIIDSFVEESHLTGYFAIIIGEWNETLRFYSQVYNNKGEVVESENGILIEK